MNLQPLNVCMSFMQPQRYIDKISDDHDIKCNTGLMSLSSISKDQTYTHVYFLVFLCQYMLIMAGV